MTWQATEMVTASASARGGRSVGVGPLPRLALPTQHVALDEIGHAQPVEHGEEVGAVVHAVHQEVGDRAPVGSLDRRLFQRVGPQLVEPAAGLQPARRRREVAGDRVQAR
jgi:hypothetical protein